ncbi:hypothetical protein [Vogesella sp. AC12]|uniref:hypothetical protein n=1 Tax=Vogesella sp. AC12 TaxID=2950550 RepID=UPI00210A6805|nr:hypothetical protein [Vogesella sp. AC12]MCQ4143619.1 hypothetical protein [Vogesella sp. AC12]
MWPVITGMVTMQGAAPALQHVTTDMTGPRCASSAPSSQESDGRTSWPAIEIAAAKFLIEMIRQALIGHDRPEHLFALQQAVTLYDCYQEQVALCDQHIDQILHGLATYPKARHHGMRQRNGFAFDARAARYVMLGQDLTRTHGMSTLPGVKTGGGMR